MQWGVFGTVRFFRKNFFGAHRPSGYLLRVWIIYTPADNLLRVRIMI